MPTESSVPRRPVRTGHCCTSEAAPQTDKACSEVLPGASLSGASYPPQPRTLTQETAFGNLAHLQGSARLKTSSAKMPVRRPKTHSRRPGRERPAVAGLRPLFYADYHLRRRRTAGLRHVGPVDRDRDRLDDRRLSGTAHSPFCFGLASGCRPARDRSMVMTRVRYREGVRLVTRRLKINCTWSGRPRSRLSRTSSSGSCSSLLPLALRSDS